MNSDSGDAATPAEAPTPPNNAGTCGSGAGTDARSTPVIRTAGTANLLDGFAMDCLVGLARRGVEESVLGGGLPAIETAGLPPVLNTWRGSFVTLTHAGALRGCIGTVFPTAPLAQAVLENARSAALRDPRFPPVTQVELPAIEIEVSVLTEPRPLKFVTPEDLLRQLRPGIDGVLLRIGGHSATFLPQVWEKLQEPQAFLGRLAEKAGCRVGDWRARGTLVMVYEAQYRREAETSTGHSSLPPTAAPA